MRRILTAIGWTAALGALVASAAGATAAPTTASAGDAAAARPRCRTDLGTLASAHASYRITWRTPVGTQEPADVTQDLVVSRGGAVVLMEQVQQASSSVPLHRRLRTGLLPDGSRASLGFLFVPEVDLMPDCVVENDTDGQLALEGSLVVTLYPPGRTPVHLTILYADPGTSTLPACSNAERLVDSAVFQTAGIARWQELRSTHCP